MSMQASSRLIVNLLACVSIGGFLCFPILGSAVTLPANYPRLANYYLTSPITIAEAKELARWDVLVLGAQLQQTNPEIFPILRELNPDIILLAYVASEELPAAYRSLADPRDPRALLASGVSDSWFLKSADDTPLSNWPGTTMLNVTLSAPVVDGQQWNSYLPSFVHTTILSTKLWNGVFYDNVWPDISWLNGGNVDANNDGRADTSADLDAAWAEGMSSLLAYSRRLEGNDAIIIGNGGGQYYTSMNGRLMEGFPSASEGGWTGCMKKYIDVLRRGAAPPTVIVNGNSTTGASTDYRAMRFAFASTLLGDGFFSFDFGPERHADLWWYDEYSVQLGKPVSVRTNIVKPSSSTIEPGIWRRDFENGIVLLNS
ncbi:MAG: putative glycoside hydrolase, partial [bacterium]